MPTYLLTEIEELGRRGHSIHLLLPETTERMRMWQRITGLDSPRPGAKLSIDTVLVRNWYSVAPEALGELEGSLEPELRGVVDERPALRELYREAAASQLAGHFWVGMRAWQRLGGKAIERVHAHFASDDAIAALFLARAAGVPCSMTTHARDIFVPRSLPRLLWTLREMDRIFTISEYNRGVLEALERAHPMPESVASRASIAAKLCVTHLGLETSKLPVAEERENVPPQFLCSASGLVEKKGLPVLLDACERLQSEGVAVRCEIVGTDVDGSQLRRYREEVVTRGLDQSVFFLGLIPSGELMDRLADCDLFVLPCVEAADGDRDGIPVSLMEAMGVGIPVVTTRISGIPELVEDGSNGVLVEPGDPIALADSLKELFGRPELRAKLGARARQTVRERFSVARYVDELIAGWGASRS